MSLQSREILANLIAFPTISRSSNLELMAYVRGLVEPLGARVEVVTSEQDRQNLWITVGPDDVPGVVLSGHSDVVPVAGQPWSRDPFTMAEADGRLYGRGTADMKGFLASALRCVMEATRRTLKTPLHLAISYDEEIGCVGVRSMLDILRERPVKPLLCWIGEPTSMRLATGHKGKSAFRATFTGRPAHSALAPTGLNAIHLASDFIQALRRLQAELAASTAADHDYDVPYSTVHIGTIAGGEALNIVPGHCTLDFEIRNVGGDDPLVLETRIRSLSRDIIAPLQTNVPEAEIAIEAINAYPGLDTRHPEVLRFMRELTGSNQDTLKVAFGTEGGLFSTTLGVPTVICGPGSMDQGHKADEFVTVSQLDQCDTLLRKLTNQLEKVAIIN